ncbi:hydroxymethylpyrimidine/phosphomethylpyrimidine kinase [Rhodoblastus acidophilus]|uniref:bifunctional hydroxymethylpyrimidine kinase/phosphomethylpyrimidine kinase n=1 Tax=Rhodoblastus acidophilus TaxID=1074 RepID=UPI0022243B27|nr:bifunctional hydroxymethylpyrimidine kinase/phosphomethylpyrimidine kinase [Rhodoblastus acidophilus]MCW2284445.1 hydroxymethylpyrimidine/phosphomethylpyrimidine kinase [Rhodoblastus acidophilus]MCW2333292.1 hydroxymethylpyrimidine/phosphomethylpyrimidine kinase [Rhodoblastus acidophilus]
MTAAAKILSIAGSDPSGGAGVQADLKTFAAFGCYGMAAISALTAQNTLGVQGVSVVPADFVAQQIDSIFADIAVDAVKIGMIGAPENATAIASALSRAKAKNIVLDPVLVATSGHQLGGDVMAAPLQKMFALARVVTPNLIEAARLLGGGEARGLDDMRDLALRLRALGAPAVLVKGGHLQGDALDLLYDGAQFHQFTALRVPTRNTHGTGCALSSAIAALLGLGFALPDAVGRAKAWLTRALQAGAEIHIGGGHGPPHHFCDCPK